jgi:hypothetical protein
MTHNVPAVYDVSATSYKKQFEELQNYKSLECGAAQAACGAA